MHKKIITVIINDNKGIMYILLLFFLIQESYPKKTYVNMFCDDFCLKLYINGIL